MLEQLPSARRDAETDDFIQRVSLAPLPSVRSPDWPVAARRALVERLLELTAARGEYAWVDALSRQLAASYENRAAPQPIADEVPLTRTPPEAHESAAALWRVWLFLWRLLRAIFPDETRDPGPLSSLQARR